MTKKATKRALLSSALALVVCISMLIGTTYAWFTDSVTSANNIIKSGNLDVELYYQVEGQTDWTKVTSTSNIFKADALWEPGHTEVVKLKVVNEGTLALKYNLGVNIASEIGSVNVAGEAFKLSNYIKYGIVAGAQTYTRDQAIAAVDATATALKSAWNSGTVKLDAKNDTDSDENIVTMVVYMPTTVGNEANYKKGFAVPTINLGINLFATQLMAEKDSFGDDYDVNATWIGIIPESLDETTLEIVPVDKAKTGTITINSAEDLVYLNKLAKEWVSLYSNGNGTSVTNYSVNNGGKGSDYYYHSQWTIELAADLDMNNIPMDSIDITYWGNFNGNGHTISNVVLNEGQIGLFNNDVKAISNLTVKNIVVTAPKTNTVGAVANKGSMKNVHVENATVIGGKYVGGICGKGSSFINCSIKNSTVTGNDKTVGGLVGYSVGDPGTATVSGNVVENVAVTGAYNVGGLLGQAQNETVENNTVKNVTVTSTAKLPSNASSNEVLVDKLAARSAFANTVIGTNTIENVIVNNVIGINSADELVNAFASLTAGDTLYITNDIDMTGKTIAPVTGNKGFTMIGNGYTISNLASTERALFVAHSGSSSYTFDGVVLENCSVDSVANYGALFVGDGDTSDAITIKNCVVNNCTVKSAKYAAAFVAYTAGYDVQNNGPVYSDVLISNCKVIGGSITGGGSAGAAVGHSGGNPDTTTTIENLKVDGVAINGEDAEHTGIVVGTAHIGKTIINNVDYNNVTGNYNTTTVIYGRFVPGTTGALTIDGVSK